MRTHNAPGNLVTATCRNSWIDCEDIVDIHRLVLAGYVDEGCNRMNTAKEDGTAGTEGTGENIVLGADAENWCCTYCCGI